MEKAMRKQGTKYNMEFLESFLGNIRFAGFDFDDTLVDEQYWVGQRWQKVLQTYAYLSPKLKTTFFKIYKQRGPRYKFHVNDTLKALQLDEKLAPNIVKTFLVTHTDERLLPGAQEIIQFLKKKGLTVGIITNGKQTLQEVRIKQTGMYNWLDFTFYGDEQQKNDVRVFKKFVSLFTPHAPERFLFVGNELLEDIQPVVTIGSKACWVSKHVPPLRTPRTMQVKTLRELLTYVKKYHNL